MWDTMGSFSFYFKCVSCLSCYVSLWGSEYFLAKGNSTVFSEHMWPGLYLHLDQPDPNVEAKDPLRSLVKPFSYKSWKNVIFFFLLQRPHETRSGLKTTGLRHVRGGLDYQRDPERDLWNIFSHSHYRVHMRPGLDLKLMYWSMI